jgi:aryl-alcohol dehydrogenase-like predicted oxidoreductase
MIFQTEKMIYRAFGKTGLKISVISLGTMINYHPNNQQQDE